MSVPPPFLSTESSEPNVKRQMLTEIEEADDTDKFYRLYCHLNEITYITRADSKEWSLSELKSLVGEHILFFNDGQLLPRSLQTEEVQRNLKLHKQWEKDYEKRLKMMKSNNIESLIYKCRTKIANWIRPGY